LSLDLSIDILCSPFSELLSSYIPLLKKAAFATNRF